MIFSVYSYDRRQFDYFEAPGPKGTHAGAPPRSLLGASSTGVAPEVATWKLPIGAKKVGSGPLPKGRVASNGSAMGLGGLSEAVSIPIALGVILLAARFLR